MKIAVLLMAVNAQPSLRNVEAFKDTVVRYCNSKERKNEYHFYIYWSDKEIESDVMSEYDSIDNVTNIVVNEDEGVYRTFEKTYRTFKFIQDVEYDLYVRVNISMYLNIDLLDAVADKLKKDVVYCNAINSHVNGSSEYLNDLYPRGDLMIFGRDVFNGIIAHGAEFMYSDMNFRKRDGIDHVDDCLIGASLIKYFGNDYYKHLEMLRYNFVPGYEIDMRTFDSMAIGNRVKTVPQGLNSGYSWDDNDYRLKDVEKFHKLYDIYNEIDKKYKGCRYKGIILSDIVVENKNARPTVLVILENYSVKDVFWKVLENKRRSQ